MGQFGAPYDPSPLISVSMAFVLRLAPQSKPSQERILVVSQTGARRKVIDDLDGMSESLVEVESNPAAAQVVRFAQGAPVNHRPWVTDRDRVIIPVLYQSLHSCHHPAGGQIRA